MHRDPPLLPATSDQAGELQVAPDVELAPDVLLVPGHLAARARVDAPQRAAVVRAAGADASLRPVQQLPEVSLVIGPERACSRERACRGLQAPPCVALGPRALAAEELQEALGPRQGASP